MINNKKFYIQHLWFTMLVSVSAIVICTSNVYCMNADADETLNPGKRLVPHTREDGPNPGKKIHTEEIDEQARRIFDSIKNTGENLTQWARDIFGPDFLEKLSHFVKNSQCVPPTESKIWKSLREINLCDLDSVVMKYIFDKPPNAKIPTKNEELWDEFLSDKDLRQRVFHLIVQNDTISFEDWQQILAKTYHSPDHFIPEAELFLRYCDIKEDSFSQKDASISGGFENVMGLEKITFKHVIAVIVKSMSHGNMHKQESLFALRDFLKSWYGHNNQKINDSLKNIEQEVQKQIFLMKTTNNKDNFLDAYDPSADKISQYIKDLKEQLNGRLDGFDCDDLDCLLYKQYEEDPSIRDLLKKLFNLEIERMNYQCLRETILPDTDEIYKKSDNTSLIHEEIQNFFVDNDKANGFLAPHFPLYMHENSKTFSSEEIFFYGVSLKIQKMFTSIEKGSLRWMILDWLDRVSEICENGSYLNGLKCAIEEDPVNHSKVFPYKLNYVDEILRLFLGDTSTVESLLQFSPQKINSLKCESFIELLGHPFPKDPRIRYQDHCIPIHNLSKSLCNQITEYLRQALGSLVKDLAEFSKNCLRAHNYDQEFVGAHYFFVEKETLFFYSESDHEEGSTNGSYPFFDPNQKFKFLGQGLESFLKEHIKDEEHLCLEDILDRSYKKQSRMLSPLRNKEKYREELYAVFGQYLINHMPTVSAESCDEGIFARLIFELFCGKWGLLDATKMPKITFNCDGNME